MKQRSAADRDDNRVGSDRLRRAVGRVYIGAISVVPASFALTAVYFGRTAAPRLSGGRAAGGLLILSVLLFPPSARWSWRR